MAKSVSSATNVRAISFAENRTFRAFVLLYAVMSLLILSLLGFMYYRYQKALMLSEHRLSMQLQAENYLPRLIEWMKYPRGALPEDIAYDSAIFYHGVWYSGELSQMPDDLSVGIHKKEEAIYLVIALGSYGYKYASIVLQTQDDKLWFRLYWQRVLMGGGALFIVLLLLGIWLSHLFLRPMREAVNLLDRFIKDTTHELNTPVTAILTNIERLESESMDERARRKIERIAIAGRTIETIYDDLTYLLLNHKVHTKETLIDVRSVLQERLKYFKTRYQAKGLAVSVDASEPMIVRIDARRLTRVLDNLLSNAIKYSDRNGNVTISLTKRTLAIANSGPGIPLHKLSTIFERYERAESSRGGFGIGLHIVARIAKEYGIDISVESQENWTRFTLTWPLLNVK